MRSADAAAASTICVISVPGSIVLPSWPNFAARLIASACTVRLSGWSFSIFSRVSCISAASSPGSPAIRSILILSNPSSRARWKICSTSSTVCFLPTRSSVFCCIVCGLTEMRVTGYLRITSSFSRVILSGLPASTVNSSTCSKSKFSRIVPSSRSSWSASSVVGVPPPIYTVSSVFPCISFAVAFNSLIIASR